MKRIMIITAVAILVLGLGCSGKKSNPFEGKTQDQANKLMSQKIDEIQKAEPSAEKFADLGEVALESPRGAEVAILAFEKALELDSENSKANFYSALLLPALRLQGLSLKLTKILTPEVIGEMTEELLEDISNKEVRNIVSNFLMGAPTEDTFKTPSEFQNFLVTKFLPTVLESQKRLEKVSKNRYFRITFHYENWGNGRIWSGLRDQVVLDQVEVHSAQMALRGVATMAKIISSYNLDAGVILRDQFRGRRHVTMKEMIEAIKTHPKLLTLNSGGSELLGSILKDASDSIEGLKIIANLLPIDRHQRKENLIPPFKSERSHEGLMRGLVWTSDVLAGPLAVPIGRRNHKEVTVIMDGTVLFAKPVSDLKGLLPTEFSQDGKKAKAFADLTFGGVIPKGDLISTYCSLGKKYSDIECPSDNENIDNPKIDNPKVIKVEEVESK